MTITDNGKSATVKVTSKENSPETLNGIAVNADATAVKEHLGLSNSNDDNARVTKVTGYLGGLVTEFGIKNDENTKITVAKDSNDVTIEFVVEE